MTPSLEEIVNENHVNIAVLVVRTDALLKKVDTGFAGVIERLDTQNHRLDAVEMFKGQCQAVVAFAAFIVAVTGATCLAWLLA